LSHFRRRSAIFLRISEWAAPWRIRTICRRTRWQSEQRSRGSAVAVTSATSDWPFGLIASPRSPLPAGHVPAVTELLRHKRVDLALEAARRAGLRSRPSAHVGSWSDCVRDTASTQRSLGRVGDRELTELYSGALALLVPIVEEFGIAAVEAQAACRPVVAPAARATLETVVPDETGVLVRPGDPDALADALRTTNFRAFSPGTLREPRRASPTRRSRPP
jgi:glycosyltransferase involved in cell wall biosynthesis